MTRFALYCALVCSVAMGVSGCMTIPVSLSASTVPVNHGDYSVVGETRGMAWGFQIFGYNLGEPNQAGTARDRAIANAEADGLVNVAVDLTQIVIPGIPFASLATSVYGDAFKLNE